MEIRVGVEDFLVKAFEKVYITIWSCMKLEDVLKVFPMLMLKKFVDQFVFIWGWEQCSKTIGQISLGSHYYLKELKCIYYGYRGLPYGTEDQTLFIDDESVCTLWWPFMYVPMVVFHLFFKYKKINKINFIAIIKKGLTYLKLS